MAKNIIMKSKVLKLIVIIAVLLAAIIFALPYIVDVNRFRPEIEETLTDALGREVKLGDLKLSLYSGSVRIDDVSIADNPAFNDSPFLFSESFQASVELKPLIFSKEIRITRILLDHPEITFVRSSAGKWNIADLGPATGDIQVTSSDDSGSISEQALSIHQVKISEGRIIYIDGNQKSFVYDDVNLVVHDFSSISSFPFALTASLPGGGSLKLEGKAGPLHKSDTTLTPAEAELEAADLDLVAAGFIAPDSGISGTLTFKGTVASDGRRVLSQGQAEADGIQLVKGGTPAGRPISVEYLIDYDLAGQKGILNRGEIQSGQAIARLNGDFDLGRENLVLKLRLLGSDMPIQDLISLFPAFGFAFPRGASLEGGTLDVDLTAEGSLEEMVTTGTAEISETRLTGFDLVGKMAALASLTGIQSRNITDIETLTSGMHLTPEGIYLSDILFVMPALGTLSGVGKIDTDQSLDFVMRAELKPSGALGAGFRRLLKRDSLSIPFLVRGTSSDPKFVLDAKNAGTGLLRSRRSNQDSAKADKGDAFGDMPDNLLR